MLQKPGWKKKLRYLFDNMFSTGPVGLASGLGILSIVIVIISAVLVTVLNYALPDEESFSFGEAMWWSLLQTIGEGGIAGRGTAWGFRLWMLVVSLASIFLVSNFIGIIANGIQEKLANLRKGRSEVIEEDHTIILGWSDHIYTIISEIIHANGKSKKSVIVVLSELEKTAMEDKIRQRIKPDKQTRIVCRTGSPIELTDLSLVNFNAARTIIILSPESQHPDSEVIKTVLAILNHPQRRIQPFHIVATLREMNSREIAPIVGNNEVEWIFTSDVVARIIAQTSQQPGLSLVYSDLLDFNANEIYFSKVPEVVGKPYSELLSYFSNEAVIGIEASDGGLTLNPPSGTLYRANDRLVLIAADDDGIQVDSNGKIPANQNAIQLITSPFSPRPENTLILGWNWRGHAILDELDHYLNSGSTVLVIANEPSVNATLQQQALSHRNYDVSFQEGDTTSRAVLESINMAAFEHIIILSCSDQLSTQQADAATLVTLLHLRDIARKRNANFSIVTEILDMRNRELAEIAHVDDFIISDRLISLMTAQVAEEKKLSRVFREIFDPHGIEIYIKPVTQYIKTGVSVNFYTVLEAASRVGETAIGYRITADSVNRDNRYGIIINPDKEKEIVFHTDDMVIVLSSQRHGVSPVE